MIPPSGYRLRPEFAAFDAEQRFDVGGVHRARSRRCASPARSCKG